MSENRAIEEGDRFITKDRRDVGRTVEVVEALPTDLQIESTRRERAERNSRAWGGWDVDSAEEWLRQRETYYRIRTEVHPHNPDAVGNVSRVHEGTLRTKYKRVSR